MPFVYSQVFELPPDFSPDRFCVCGQKFLVFWIHHCRYATSYSPWLTRGADFAIVIGIFPLLLIMNGVAVFSFFYKGLGCFNFAFQLTKPPKPMFLFFASKLTQKQNLRTLLVVRFKPIQLSIYNHHLYNFYLTGFSRFLLKKHTHYHLEHKLKAKHLGAPLTYIQIKKYLGTPLPNLWILRDRYCLRQYRLWHRLRDSLEYLPSFQTIPSNTILETVGESVLFASTICS